MKPTPKTVAWGYYDAKTPPVLRIKSGDTVEVQTLITNSAKRLEEAGVPLEQDGSKILIHCAAGVHRAPMMALAVLRAMGWELDDACKRIQARRYAADFADVYVRSVEDFMRSYAAAQK